MSTEEFTRSPSETPGGKLLVAEYTSLRDEIIKRIEIQHQLLSLAFIAPGRFSLLDCRARMHRFCSYIL